MDGLPRPYLLTRLVGLVTPSTQPGWLEKHQLAVRYCALSGQSSLLSTLALPLTTSDATGKHIST